MIDMDKKGTVIYDHYEVLGLPSFAKLDEKVIKKAFRAKALKLHPDKRPKDSYANANAEFQRLKQSYEILKDPVARKKFDSRLLDVGTAYQKTMDDARMKYTQLFIFSYLVLGFVPMVLPAARGIDLFLLRVCPLAVGDTLLSDSHRVRIWLMVGRVANYFKRGPNRHVAATNLDEQEHERLEDWVMV